VTTTALVWLVVGLLSLTAVLAMLVALIRHLFVLGRTVSRFQGEVGPLAREISDLSGASRRSARMPRRPRSGP
jgi:hypothetical protein